MKIKRVQHAKFRPMRELKTAVICTFWTGSNFEWNETIYMNHLYRALFRKRYCDTRDHMDLSPKREELKYRFQSPSLLNCMFLHCKLLLKVSKKKLPQ